MKSGLMEELFHTLASYCQASLAFSHKDRYKALEGIGQHMANHVDDIYCRGILGKTLPVALLWSSTSWAPGRPSFKRSPATRAPTWHWASYESPHDFENTIRILNYARTSKWIIVSTAYVFMSYNCNTLSSPTTTLWPSLICFGRLVRVGVLHSTSKYWDCMLHPFDSPSGPSGVFGSTRV